MSELNIVYGENNYHFKAEDGQLIGDVIAETGLPFEQPCAGRGTCGRCKILVESGGNPPDEVEKEHLSPGELSMGTRLACRARISGKTQIVLSQVTIYSNKAFKASDRYKAERDVDLGLAVDLGSTTAATYLVMLDNGEIALGGAALNQQRVYGADIISRLQAAINDQASASRLQKLAISSINHSINAMNLNEKILARVKKVGIVGNVAMHHLLLGLPVESVAMAPFQPHMKDAVLLKGADFWGAVPENAQVACPPLIGGFVGSDALACLAAFDFDTAAKPMLAIDLGTNGEVLLTDGKRIVCASTAAGPAFEGVNISCGMRAVDGAVVSAKCDGDGLHLETIGGESPAGLTGSGLLSLVQQLRTVGVITSGGRMVNPAITLPGILKQIEVDAVRRLPLTEDGGVYLSQMDIRELQKAKGAIKAAVLMLLNELNLEADDLERVILTGSFGSQIDIESAIGLGVIPNVEAEKVVCVPNGAGIGAALFLTDAGMERAKRIAEISEQIDLDQSREFQRIFIESLALE